MFISIIMDFSIRIYYIKEVKLCKHCDKLFIVEDIKSEYDTVQRKKYKLEIYLLTCILVRETGIEPVRVHHPQDFKSCASACSATRA